ncbi:hypothetical protein ACO2Q0_09105 [Phenylobacterium sp. VNQ135]|uniref:hypothetical protein n=1 Tax=Phenylobacterium sp. VNQ135 TaxID=3400922 RepID=UPI003C03541B
MAKAVRKRADHVEAASFFMTRAQDAISAAEGARSEDACAAFYKEAETWLYMAGRCLNPEAQSPRPETFSLGTARVRGERRSFEED